MHKVVLQASVLSVALLSVMVSFGMRELTVYKEQPQELFQSNDTYTMDNQFQAILPVELMQKTATHGNGKVKNNVQQTCRLYNNACSKYNPGFISSFKVDETDADDIVCFAAWFNNAPLENAIREQYKINKIRFNITKASDVNKYPISLYVPVDGARTLRNKHNNADKDAEIAWDIEPTYYFAVKWNDYHAIGNISQKMNRFTGSMPHIYTVPRKIDLQKFSLIPIIQKDRTEIFKIIVKKDPFNALNCYCYASEDVQYGPFLDILNSSEDIPEYLKKKYARIYSACGGRTFKQLQRKNGTITTIKKVLLGKFT